MTVEDFLAELIQQKKAFIYNTDCVIWDGFFDNTARIPKGRIQGSVVSIIHYVWKLSHGPISIGHKLENVCGHRRCCNPTHWRTQTSKTQVEGATGVAHLLSSIDSTLAERERWHALQHLLEQLQKKGSLASLLEKAHLQAPKRVYAKYDCTLSHAPKYDGVGVSEHRIYILIDTRTGCVMYVGCTKKPQARLAQHRRLSKTDSKLMKEWKKDLLCSTENYIDIVEVDSVDSIYARDAEKAWIEYFLALGSLLNTKDYKPSTLPEGARHEFGRGSLVYRVIEAEQ